MCCPKLVAKNYISLLFNARICNTVAIYFLSFSCDLHAQVLHLVQLYKEHLHHEYWLRFRDMLVLLIQVWSLIVSFASMFIAGLTSGGISRAIFLKAFPWIPTMSILWHSSCSIVLKFFGCLVSHPFSNLVIRCRFL